jgi:hypothetical protein
MHGRRETDEWKTGSLERSVNESIAVLSVCSLVRSVVELDSGENLGGSWITQDEVHVLLYDTALQPGTPSGW